MASFYAQLTLDSMDSMCMAEGVVVVGAIHPPPSIPGSHSYPRVAKLHIDWFSCKKDAIPDDDGFLLNVRKGTTVMAT